VTGDDEFGRHTRFRHELRERGERYVHSIGKFIFRSPEVSMAQG
jgi:hypothetical protein